MAIRVRSNAVAAAFGNDDLRRVGLQGTRHFLFITIHTEGEPALEHILPGQP